MRLELCSISYVYFLIQITLLTELKLEDLLIETSLYM